MIRAVGLRRANGFVSTFQGRSSAISVSIRCQGRFSTTTTTASTATDHSRQSHTHQQAAAAVATTVHDEVATPISVGSAGHVPKPRMKVQFNEIVQHFEQIQASRNQQKQQQQSKQSESEQQQQDQDENQLEEIDKTVDEFAQHMKTLTDDEKIEYLELWNKPHVRHAAKEIAEEPRVYRRFYQNKDVARFIELAGLKPWESMPVLDVEYPQSPKQDIPSIWQVATGPLKKELEMGGPKAMYPEMFPKLRSQEDWGTLDDPVLVPTTQKDRIVECQGNCVPFNKGKQRMWVMSPGDWCICSQCLQYFHCFDSRVYDPEQYPPEQLALEKEREYKQQQPPITPLPFSPQRPNYHEDEDENNADHSATEQQHHEATAAEEEEEKEGLMIEPRKTPLQIAQEWEASRRREDEEDLKRIILEERRFNQIIEEFLPKVQRKIGSNRKIIQDLLADLKKLWSSPIPIPRDEPVDLGEGSGIRFWFAKRRAARRAAEDRWNMLNLMETLTQEENDLKKPPSKPSSVEY